MNILLFALLYILFFTAMWLGITALISFFGGWFSLAKRYSNDEPKSSAIKVFHFQSLRFGKLTWYRSVVQIAIYPEGLYFKNLFLFRFLHKPIFIPWSDIKPQWFAGFLLARVLLDIDGKKIAIFGRCAKYLDENGYLK